MPRPGNAAEQLQRPPHKPGLLNSSQGTHSFGPELRPPMRQHPKAVQRRPETNSRSHRSRNRPRRLRLTAGHPAHRIRASRVKKSPEPRGAQRTAVFHDLHTPRQHPSNGRPRRVIRHPFRLRRKRPVIRRRLRPRPPRHDMTGRLRAPSSPRRRQPRPAAPLRRVTLRPLRRRRPCNARNRAATSSPASNRSRTTALE
jgi:hypothetical protein